MSNMSAMDADNDMVSEPVTMIVVSEAVDGSNNVGTLVTTQQSNKTMRKKTQFTWSHHGMNPKFVETYIIHEKNYKDEILIHHLIQVAPWKARHGQVKSAWGKVMNGILWRNGKALVFLRVINVSTIRNRYQNVYLVLGDKLRKEREQQNVEEASEDEEPDNNNEQTTKQLKITSSMRRKSKNKKPMIRRKKNKAKWLRHESKRWHLVICNNVRPHEL